MNLKEEQELCIQCALSNTPPNLKAVTITDNGGGWADEQNQVLYSPKPNNRSGLTVYLHECAHFYQKRKHPSYLIEFEAEMWAYEQMKQFGLTPPRSQILRGKHYLAFRIQDAIKHGAKNIPAYIVKYTSRLRNKYEYVKTGDGMVARLKGTKKAVHSFGV